MTRTLVIRFGALGDLCLCGWFLSLLHDRTGTRVTLVTKERFAGLAAAFDGVEEVVPLAGDGGLGELRRLAGRLRAGRWDRILDAHAVLRSALLLAMLRRFPTARLRKGTLSRWRQVAGWHRGADALAPHLVERLAALVPGLDLPAPPLPTALAPLRSLVAAAPRRGIAVAPGARWPAKRWPTDRFARLVEILLAEGYAPVTIVVGPQEMEWFPGSALAAAAERPGVELLESAPLPEVAALLARCRATVTNDSGLLHLSEAVGTPVVALFGPTVRSFGYTPVLPGSRLLEVDLPCRPCSRTGSRPCHRGDLACLTGIGVDEVAAAVDALSAAVPEATG